MAEYILVHSATSRKTGLTSVAEIARRPRLSKLHKVAQHFRKTNKFHRLNDTRLFIQDANTGNVVWREGENLRTHVPAITYKGR